MCPMERAIIEANVSITTDTQVTCVVDSTGWSDTEDAEYYGEINMF